MAGDDRRIFLLAAEPAARLHLHDADLVTLGRVGRGEALIAMGEARQGMTQLDEAMIAVIADEVSPTIAGIVYCSVITACQATFDLRRAQEWTAALTKWCERQPDMVPYRGQCLLSRAQLMQLRGRWGDAEREARLASERLQVQRMDRETGEAIYQHGSVHASYFHAWFPSHPRAVAALLGAEPVQWDTAAQP